MMLSKVLNRTTTSMRFVQRATQATLLMPQYRTFAPVTKYKFDDEDWEPNQFQVRRFSSLTDCLLVIVRNPQDERRRIDQ